MFEQIRKRDGRLVPFDADKITAAIAKAGQVTGELDWARAERLTTRVLTMALDGVEPGASPTVEGIQDLVEEVLLASSFKKTAKAYVLYRDQHAKIRDLASAAGRDLIESYLGKSDWQVSENSNMSFSLQGLNNYLCSEVTKNYWLNEIYPREIREAHSSGDFHVHDLSLLSVYCVGWDLRDLLTVGFQGAPGKAESKPARHFRSALGQIVNFFYTLQGEASGAQAFASFDTYLAPFIRHDNLSYDEVKQALQEFIFNLNVPTRVGFQTPFTNVTMDLQVPRTLRDEAVLIGGEPCDFTYGDFQEEMNLLNRAFLEVMCEGDAKGRVFTFPIPTYNIDKDFDFDDPRLEWLWKVTARYGVPYFANFMNSDLSPEDARSMCCRLRLDLRKLDRRGGGLFGSNPLTGSVGVVTVNLPRLGHTADDEAGFLARLDRLMDLAVDSLEIKRKVLERLTDQGLYPYSKFYLRGVKERHGEFWHNHFGTVGLVGMNEACLNLLGCGIAAPQGKAFAARVLDHMRERLQGYQERTGHHYNLEATPAEGTSFRLALKDKQRHPNIITANENQVLSAGGKPFYTNSTQLPVDYSDDIFEVLDHQDDLQTRYTGGTVVHVYVGEELDDPQAVKTFVRRVCTGYRLPYFTLSPTFSVCPEHGYQSGKQEQCPVCGRECEVYSRIVGYLRPVNHWNDGKKAEFGLRAGIKLKESLCKPRA